MISFFKAIKGILKRKNAIIRAERERLEGAEWSNRILSAYIALLSQGGELKVKRKDVGDILGKYRAEVSRDDEYYIISLNKTCSDGAGKRENRGEH